MADTSLLERMLRETVTLNKARGNFLAKFLVALLQVKTVNLSEIANVFAGRATSDSHYKRLQRFLRFCEVPYGVIALALVKLLPLPAPYVLTMDRTSWQLGQTPLNLLVLGIAYKGVALPILWTVLEKRGNSNTAERIAIVREFVALCGPHRIAYLAGDREFIGKEWFRWLKTNRIDFRMRVKENTQVTNGRGELVPVWRLFRSQRIGTQLVIPSARRCWGLELYFSGVRLASGEYVIVVSPQAAERALSDYSRRWEIETLFGCLKSRGFRLEETHVTDPARLKKLLAFCWAVIVGEWLVEQKPLTVKKHGRLAKSVFRHGLDHLRRILCNLQSRAQQIAFRRVILLLSCT
ncbi:MAG: IS4 family transposase [Acidobacteriota bacterium]|nr:IS4 family transposase [Acidobacteriota bacterium]